MSDSSMPEAADGSGQSSGKQTARMASRRQKFIDPGEQVPTLTSSDKVSLGFRAAFSPFAAFGWISAAAYSQALDSSPNYGQGWGPFGQRFGAAAARGFSEGIFTDSVLCPLLHEDPRYFRLGPGHNVVHRALYAATRSVVTRTDSGSASPNWALLGGNAAGSILTNAYYPQVNRNPKDTLETFAGSIGGSALGFFIREFLADAVDVVHSRGGK